MALLVISLLLLSTALLSEAIDSVGTIPFLNFGREKTESGHGFSVECNIEEFMNETEKIAVLRIRGVSGTKYLRAVVFEKYSDGKWTIPEFLSEPYRREYISPWVHSYSRELSRVINITPLVNITGYVSTVLNLEKLDSEVNLDYNKDYRIFFSKSPFATDYSPSYRVYFYDTEMLEQALVIDDPKNLEIPVKISDTIARIAEDAAVDAETPYGKVMKLISYLQENHNYNAEYPQAPKGIDPVIWFLTASKSGVCTHFNSALVLLARSVGVPARLAGGFLINSEKEVQIVYQNQRHVYAEIHFEELGWIIFDATPSANCSLCEGLERGEEGERADKCEPVDNVFNQSECKDCVNNCTKMSPEGSEGPDIDLFEIFGITGTNYLRTMVGELYDGFWSLNRPDPRQYVGETISYEVSGYYGKPSYAFLILPLTQMGGFIPTALYTNELSLDSKIQRYPDQHIFFSEDIFEESYTLSYTNYEFNDSTLQGAIPFRDPRYMNVPGHLLEILRELALTVTSGAETPYEKLKSLESYLKTNYVYALNYTRAPDGVDPVEWFLFHEKRGVCPNFNSAFVLLARSIGLPARLVGGYVIDSTAERQVVNARQGHAYSEVLFEGIGWITFDATAPGQLPEELPAEEIETVINTSTKITEQDLVGVRGFTFGVLGEVVDENGESVDGLQTLVYLKETKEDDGLLVGEGPVVDGFFNVTCILPLNISNGYYLIQAHTLGDYVYNGSWSDPPLKVVTKTDIVLSMPEKAIAGRTFPFHGSLTEHMTREPIAHAICTVKTGLEETRFETDDNGYFEGSYKSTQPGEYAFSLEWSGSEYFIGSITSTSVRVVPLTITPDEIEMMVRNEESIISGRVHAEDLPGDNEYVVISLDGKEIGTAYTGEDGSFTFTHVVPRTQELGEVQLECHLESNSYTTSQQSAVYARTNIELEAPDYVSVMKPFNIEVGLTDDLTNPIGNAIVTLESDETGQSTKTTTNINGTKEIPLKIMDVPASEYISYRVSYNGSGYYLESTSSVSLKLTSSMIPKIDVITAVTNGLILSVLCLAGYTAFIMIRKRMRKESADESAELPEEHVEPEPEEKRQVVGIIRSNERLLFEFPQIVDPFPFVWEVGDGLVVRLGLSKVGGEYEESSEVQLVVDDVEGPNFALVVDKYIDHTLTFTEKGYHRIKAQFLGVDTSEAACEAVVKIVDYREEVNHLFNDEFEEYKGTREEIKTHFTAREFMHTILEGLSDKFHGPLNEMVTVFEIADYSLHDIRRREYERFYAARREFEGMKIGK